MNTDNFEFTLFGAIAFIAGMAAGVCICLYLGKI